MASIFKRRKGKHEPYTIQYTDHAGKRRTSVGYTDKGLTEQLAAKLETDARLRRTGMVDTEQERLAQSRQSPLESHLQAYEVSQSDNSPAHVSLTMNRIRAIVAGAGFAKLDDIRPEPIQACLRGMKQKADFSHRTYNHYLQAIKSFCNWCVATERLVSNPLRGVAYLNAEVDIRHPRRALTPAEFDRLLTAARESRKNVQTYSPEARCRIYLFACLTGLRKQEMASLTASSFGLDDSPPTVTVAAAISKHRRKDVLPLHPELVSQLRQWLKGLKPDDKLFPSLGKKQLSLMIQKDLKRAGIPYRTAEGIADFHAAGRHTYITQLLRSGATLPEAKELARHTDVRMTMRYTHIGIGDQARAVGNLPMPGASPKGPISAESHQEPALQMRCISGGAEGHSMASHGTEFPNDERLNPRDTMSLGVKCHRLSSGVAVDCTGKMPVLRINHTLLSSAQRKTSHGLEKTLDAAGVATIRMAGVA
ncbi:MAG: site-specific integrase [Planctomycetaceae bacterium]|nr:site-specific integrase [Planctomycetaceae bacterium]